MMGCNADDLWLPNRVFALKLQDTNRLSYGNFYFPPKIGQYMVHVIKYGWPCPMDCVGHMWDIGVMANHLKHQKAQTMQTSVLFNNKIAIFKSDEYGHCQEPLY